MAMKPISEIPDYRHAEDLGLKKVTNGYVGWLVDGEGNQYSPPQWLLDLLHDAKEEGRKEGQHSIRESLRHALGLNADEPIVFHSTP